MAHTEPAIRTVQSRDGTEIGYWTSGQGPPLVVVHGATADHTRWRPALPYLEEQATIHAIDRRGRGASGDAPDYTVEREFEDIAAVIDAVAEASGEPVDLLGHSFGGVCSIGAATLTSNLRKLVLYEPAANPDASAFPPGVEERLDALLAVGDREAVIETFFREVVLMPDHELEVFRSLPAWQARIAAAHTITREVRAVLNGAFEPERTATVKTPTLMLLGGDSPQVVKDETAMVAAALPDVRVVVLDGQQHIAIDLIPERFAQEVIAFLRQ